MLKKIIKLLTPEPTCRDMLCKNKVESADGFCGKCQKAHDAQEEWEYSRWLRGRERSIKADKKEAKIKLLIESIPELIELLKQKSRTA